MNMNLFTLTLAKNQKKTAAENSNENSINFCELVFVAFVYNWIFPW